MVLAWDAHKGKECWQGRHSTKETDVKHLVVGGQQLFTGGTAGRVCCWNTKTGQECWNIQACTSSIQTISYCNATDTVFVACSSSRVLALDGRTGDIVFDQKICNPKALFGSRQNLYIASNSSISAWNLHSGHHQYWEVQMSGIEVLTYAEELDLLFVGTSSAVAVLDSKNGSARREMDIPGGVKLLHYTSH